MGMADLRFSFREEDLVAGFWMVFSVGPGSSCAEWLETCEG